MSKREIPFLYGKEELNVSCPEENILSVVAPGDIPTGLNEEELVRQALKNPIGSKPLVEIAKPGDKVAIVTDDHARPATGYKMVPYVLEELKTAGVRDEDITIIMGSGTHRPCTQEECERLLGKDVVANYTVVSHDMDDKDNLVFLGMTSRGNSVWINRIFAQADVKILTGHIAIISFGFSGGRKSVLPAVSGRDTIYYNHQHDWITRANFGSLENNIMADDAMEAAHLAKVDFILNVVLNLEHEVIKAVAGDMVVAWMEGVRFARELYTVPLECHPDIVITSGGGSPADDTLFQSLKGFQISYLLMKRGGSLILVADCKDGIGDKELEHSLKLGPEEMFKQINEGKHVHFMADIVNSGLEKAGEVFLKSTLDPELVKECGLVPVKTVEEAIEKAFSIVGNDARILCMPKGLYVAPVINQK
ncbi:nickel-dependent lactate racemase [Planctomycetota bacterium]